MAHSTSPIDDREWFVLLQGAPRGPLDRAELGALLDTHPERWNAAVWRPGMLDWRAAGSIRALHQGAATAEPLWGHAGAPLVDPPSASVRAPRDASGELRVLSYEESQAPARTPGPTAAAPTAAQSAEVTDSRPSVRPARCLSLSGEWVSVATSELRAIDRGELPPLSAPEPALTTTGEWSGVVTSEVRAISATELRALALKESSAAATVSELRAMPKELLLRDAAAPSMILSEHTRTELPSFNFLAERADATAPASAREAPTSTPPPLPTFRRPMPALKSRSPLRTLPLVLGGLVLLSALALILIRLR